MGAGQPPKPVIAAEAQDFSKLFHLDTALSSSSHKKAALIILSSIEILK
jgi:hypothetical protein